MEVERLNLEVLEVNVTSDGTFLNDERLKLMLQTRGENYYQLNKMGYSIAIHLPSFF